MSIVMSEQQDFVETMPSRPAPLHVPRQMWPYGQPEAAHAASELDDQVKATRRALRALAGAKLVVEIIVAGLVSFALINLLARCSA